MYSRNDTRISIYRSYGTCFYIDVKYFVLTLTLTRIISDNIYKRVKEKESV